jgi:quinoprotein glucose dehydrogenase
VNKTNVRKLEIAWTYPTGDSVHYEFNPIIANGTMYVLAKNHSVVALDGATGKERWVHRAKGEPAERGLNFWQNADGSDERLVTVESGFLTTIDARTGRTVSSFGDNGFVDLRIGLDRDGVSPVIGSNPGRIFENLVIVPLKAVGQSYASTPGDIHAYDVRTGKLVWVFHTIPRPGEFGYDTWPAASWKTSGGVMNWNGMSIDQARGIAYIPLSSPKADFYGGDRPGANLFGNSLIALNARTGQRIWHYQIVHHDIWDYDLPSSPQLFTVKHNGRNIDVVAQLTKHGLLFVFDRETGEPLWPIEERPVPKSDVPGEEVYPTQPWPTKPPPYARMSFTENDINPFLPEVEQENLRDRLRAGRKNEGPFTPPSVRELFLMPGYDGAPFSSAVDPTKGMMYVITKELPTAIKLQLPRLTVPSDQRLSTMVTIPSPSPRERNPDFVPYVDPYDSLISPTSGLGAINPPWSRLVAIDVNEGTIKWEKVHGSVTTLANQGHPETGAFHPRGGPVVTAGGLIFAATSSDLKVRAYDQDDGRVLWEHDLPESSTGVPAVYQIDGREYIAFGATSVGPSGLELPVKRPQGQTRGQAGYIVFALPKL